jgi:hypothetical protein
MINIYNKYKKTNEWVIVQKAINDLIDNKDLELTTEPDYVVGYITKQLVDKKKRLLDLELRDLQNNHVWEHWTENGLEYVKPCDHPEIFENSDIGHIVLTVFTLHNMTKYFGFCSPQDLSGLDYIQPTIFTDKGQVTFWKDNGWTKEEKDKEMKKLGHEKDEVFPIDYTTKIKCDGEFYKGKIKNFNE